MVLLCILCVVDQVEEECGDNSRLLESRRCHSDLHSVQGTHQSYVQQAVVFVAFEEKYLCSSFIVDVFSRLIGYQGSLVLIVLFLGACNSRDVRRSRVPICGLCCTW